jgi:hypothetical protein
MVDYSLVKATGSAYTVLVLCLLCSFLNVVAANNVTQPISIFRSVSTLPFPLDARTVLTEPSDLIWCLR